MDGADGDVEVGVAAHDRDPDLRGRDHLDVDAGLGQGGEELGRDAGVNLEMISTSEIRISVVVREDDVNTAVGAVHKAFELDGEGEQAVVYGGTGR